MSNKRSFATRLSRKIVAIVNLLFVMSIIAAFICSYLTVGRKAVDDAQSQLRIVSLEVENTLNELEIAAATIATLASYHHNDTAYIYKLVSSIVQQHSLIIGSSVSFCPYFFSGQYFCAPYAYQNEQTGDIVTMCMGGEDYDYFHKDWYQLPTLLKKPVWTEPYFDAGASNQMMSTYSIPLLGEDEEPYAVVTIDIALDWLHQKIASIRPYTNSYMVLIGRSGHFVFHFDEQKIMHETIFDEAFRTGSTKQLEFGRHIISGDKGFMRINDNGHASFAVYGPLTNGWSTAIICPWKDIFGDINRLANLFIIVILLGVFVLYFVIKRIIKRESQPITEFTYSALSMAKGNFDTKIPEVKTKDELLRLRNSLSYMQESVGSYISELRTTMSANERFESELNIARNIQLGMVPTDFPRMDSVELFARLIPAREVGGDLYDYCVRDGVLYFAVGDVSGKGVPAALLMAICRAVVRFVSGLDQTMHERMEHVNRILCDGNENSLFVTLFWGRLDLATGELQYCNAGHNPIVVLPPSGDPFFLKAKPNFVTGLMGDYNYTDETLTLTRGSRLIIYTDGVSEAETAAKELYGEQRLLAYAAQCPATSTAEDVVDGLYDSVKSFTQGTEQNDDITIMSIYYKG